MVPALKVNDKSENKTKQPALQQNSLLSSSCPNLAKIDKDLSIFDRRKAIRRGSSSGKDKVVERLSSFSTIPPSCVKFYIKNDVDRSSEEQSEDEFEIHDPSSFDQFNRDTHQTAEHEDEEREIHSPESVTDKRFSVPLVQTELKAANQTISGKKNQRATRQRSRSVEFDMPPIQSSSTSSDDDNLDSSIEDIVVTYEDLQNEIIKSPQDDQEDDSTQHNAAIYFAKADFHNQSDDLKILDLREGEKVVVLEKRPNGWWLIENRSESRGWAPSNFLESVPQSATDEEDENTAKHHQENVLPTYDSNSDDSGIASNPNSPKSSDENTEIYRAIAKYNGVKEDGEVDLVKNKTVRVLKQTSSGWWLVASDDDIGWAPSTYLEKVIFPSQQDNKFCTESCRQVSD